MATGSGECRERFSQVAGERQIQGKEDDIRPPVSIDVVWAVSLEGVDVTGKGRIASFRKTPA